MLVRHHKRVCAACFLLLWCAVADAQTRPVAPRPTSSTAQPRATGSQPLALTHVAVLNVESGQLSNDDSVVISGNRIVTVGLNARIPRGARVTYARGKMLIPGLWDMHSHSLDP
jgi:adenine deaminase